MYAGRVIFEQVNSKDVNLVLYTEKTDETIVGQMIPKEEELFPIKSSQKPTTEERLFFKG